MRGRKPKPTAIKAKTGNPGKRPLNGAEPQPSVPATPPYAPRFLSEEGKREWRRLARLLLDTGLYTEFDYMALAMLCQVWCRWKQMEQKVMAAGEVLVSKETGNLYQNPYLHVANRAWEQMRKMLAEFGLTPSSRSRIRVALAEDEPSLVEMLFRMPDRVGHENG